MLIISVDKIKIKRIISNESNFCDDDVAVEEPLEIRILHGNNEVRKLSKVSVTMRTPGDDECLALGFLYTEGILQGIDSVEKASIDESDSNIITVHHNPLHPMDLSKLQRNFYTTSSCGVCGKSSIDSIRVLQKVQQESTEFCIDWNVLKEMPEKLNDQQKLFHQTGGLHAASLFDLSGNLLVLKEDVGRHNALDKLIGYCFKSFSLPLRREVLFLSGRASFELIQKAVMAGIKMVVAVGAPSSLAIDLAKEYNVTLVGFLKKDRCNIYCGSERILVSK